MSWQLLTAISVITFSVSMLLRRVLLSGVKPNPVAYSIIFQAVTGVLILLYAIANGFEMPDLGRYWLAALLTVALYAAGNILMTKALTNTEASIFSILFASSAIWTMLAGYLLLGDSLSPMQFVGVGLVFVSIFTLSERKRSFHIDKGLLLSLICAGVYGLASVGWIYVGRGSDPASWTAITFIAPALLLLTLRPKSLKRMNILLTKSILPKILLIAATMGITTVTGMQAYKIGNLNLVAALQQTNILVITLFGAIFLQERSQLPQKILAAVICLAGVLLII